MQPLNLLVCVAKFAPGAAAVGSCAQLAPSSLAPFRLGNLCFKPAIGSGFAVPLRAAIQFGFQSDERLS